MAKKVNKIEKEEVPFYDEIVIPQELIEADKKAIVATKPSIVKVLQKTPSGVNVLRSDGTREKLTKAEYRAEVG